MEEVTQTEKLNEEKPKSKINAKKIVKVVAGTLALISFIVLLVYKLQHPEFSIGRIILYGIISLISSTGVFFIFDIMDYSKFRKGKEILGIPSPMTIEEMKLKVTNLIESDMFENHIKSWVDIIPHNVGSNKIYEFKIFACYPNPEGIKRCNIIINSHFRDETPVINWDSTPYQSNKAANALSNKPIEEPEEEEVTTTETPSLGITTTTERKRRRSKHKEEVKET